MNTASVNNYIIVFIYSLLLDGNDSKVLPIYILCEAKVIQLLL